VGSLFAASIIADVVSFEVGGGGPEGDPVGVPAFRRQLVHRSRT
jgi:hypothetical protein